MTAFPYTTDQDGIATILIDMPGAVNVMNDAFTTGMAETFATIAQDAAVKGVVLASAKPTFFAGGDVKSMSAAPKGGFNQLITEGIARGRTMIRAMERLKVPVAAAINGAALGGGYELTLAANYRVAWDDKSVLIGLPEATLGLLPGGGGIVRMTKKFGIQKALPYLLEGRIIPAAQAHAEGLIDELAPTLDALIPRAKAWILANKDNPDAAIQPWDRPGYVIPGGDLNNAVVRGFVHQFAFKLFEQTRGLLPNQQLIFDIAVESLKLDIDTALKIEGRGLVTLIVSPIGKNMMSANFLQMGEIRRGVSRPKGFERSTVSRIGVIGAGMMGQGIAYSAAMAGVAVVLKDVSLAAAERGKGYSAALLEKAVAKAKIDDARRQTVLDLITPTDRTEDLAGCELIIEAVFEKLELKHQVTKEAEGLLTEGGVWASNTSTLPISILASAAADPSRFVGLHFFSPVDKMPLVEIIRGEATSDAALAKAFDFVRQIKKTPIVVSDKVGFFTSRTIGAQLWEGIELVAEGVHPIRVDNLAKAFGMPVGPLTLHDEISQRLSVEVQETQLAMGLIKESDNPRTGATALVRELVAQGRGGRHYGGGYYDYDAGGKHIWPELVSRYYRADLTISDDDIKDRMLFSAVIESLKCLEEGVLHSVAEGNIGSLLGIGAPAWTGGYIQFVNTFGLQRFIDRCAELAERYGERFRAPAIIAEKLTAGASFT
ncbi:MAG: enoyl-CoA hydratase/isomerase family protein [Sphingomonas sp.]|nr:enoyl-CoA hydratase/isomerase family protein [Sphingomonas sp.]